MTALRSGSATDVGRVRSSNQDVALEDPDLFAVADGMGGAVGGDVAARMAVDALRSAFQREPTVEGLRHAFAEANRAVWRQGQSESRLRGMGTTLTATALVRDPDGRQVVALANVGDSRAYVFSRGQVLQVTADHSLAEEKVRLGELTEAEAAVHPHRHILTRVLGVNPDVDVDLWELHLKPGDRILLCSDGLTNEIGDDRIRAILAKVADPREAAAALVRAAVDHGGSDNVTVVIVDVADALPDGPSSAGREANGTATPGTTGAANGDRRSSASSPSSAAAAGEAAVAAEDTADDASSSAAGASSETAAATDAPTTAVTGLRRVSSGTTPDEAAIRRGSRARGGGGGAVVSSMSNRRGAASAGSVFAPGGDDDEGEDASGEDANVPASAGAGGPRGPATGVNSGFGVQAAELRRWQPSRVSRRARGRRAGTPRLITFRLVLFFVLLAAVVVAAYALVRWYANDNWYVGIDHGDLAVYQGRPGGFLWFKPQLIDETSVTTSEVPAYTLSGLHHGHQEPSLTKARTYVQNLHKEYLITQPGSGDTATSGSSGSNSSSTSTTTTASVTQ